jgi:hypothetical protein
MGRQFFNYVAEQLSPHDVVEKLSLHDVAEKLPPHDVAEQLSPHDVAEKLSPHDGAEKLPPHDVAEKLLIWCLISITLYFVDPVVYTVLAVYLVDSTLLVF